MCKIWIGIYSHLRNWITTKFCTCHGSMQNFGVNKYLQTILKNERPPLFRGPMVAPVRRLTFTPGSGSRSPACGERGHLMWSRLAAFMRDCVRGRFWRGVHHIKPWLHIKTAWHLCPFSAAVIWNRDSLVICSIIYHWLRAENRHR